jgi:hypothetical protein
MHGCAASSRVFGLGRRDRGARAPGGACVAVDTWDDGGAYTALVRQYAILVPVRGRGESLAEPRLRVLRRCADARERRRRRRRRRADGERDGRAVVPPHMRRSCAGAVAAVGWVEPTSGEDELNARGEGANGRGAPGRRVQNSSWCPPGVVEVAEDAAESVRACLARELCAFEYTDGVAVTGALRRDALDALGRSKSPLAIHGSPLAFGACTRAEVAPRLVDPDVPNASEDADGLADDDPERGARMLMLQAAGAGERGRVLNADGAGETARPAADASLPARGRVIAASNHRCSPRACTRALLRAHQRGCAAHGHGARVRDEGRGRTR